jgi:hypothetical protein
VLACAPAQDSVAQQAASASVAAAPGEWIDLQRAAAWRGYKSETLPAGWEFDSTTGELTRRRHHVQAGDLGGPNGGIQRVEAQQEFIGTG